MKLIRGGDKKKTLRRKCNIVDELKDLLSEHINRMCVTNYCVEKIFEKIK